ncbi:MAG: hypothetical protein QXD73_04380 [Candidatus Bathyarchaeia archaeon]
MRRYCYVAYGDVSKVQLTASAKPLDALLQLGFDMYLEVSPKKWVRAVDLPNNHPIWAEMKAGAFKAGLIDGEGKTFTILNAYNPEHRALAAQHGLIINVPYTEEKRQALLNALAKIKRELRLIALSRRVAKIETVLDIERLVTEIEEMLSKKERLQQPAWDNITNKTLNVLDIIADLIPTNFERWQLQKAVEQAKREAQLETSIEESILANPEKLSEIRRMLLA